MILRENNPKATQKKNPAGGGAKKKMQNKT